MSLSTQTAGGSPSMLNPVETGSDTTAVPRPGGPLLKISGQDVFAGCGVGMADPRSESVNAGSAAEPKLAVDPRDSKRIVGVFQQGRWSTRQSARGISAARSVDAGRTFSQVALPLSRCAKGGLNYERAAFPGVSIGPDGTVYAIASSFDVTSHRNAIGVAVSTDTGQTWRNPTALDPQSNPAVTTHFPSITADPVRAGTAYAIWQRVQMSDAQLSFLLSCVLTLAGCLDLGSQDSNPIVMSVTRDGGRTWSRPTEVAPTGYAQQIYGNHILGDPRSGDLFLFYTLAQWPDNAHQNLSVPPTQYLVSRSTDGGRTWGKPVEVAKDSSSAGDIHPNTGQVVFDATGLFDTAIDAQTGKLYAVFQGTRFSEPTQTPFGPVKLNRIEMASSTDHGRTWSEPVLVSTTPTPQAMLPNIAVNPRTGAVAISYYDIRTLTPDNTTTLPASTWITVSSRGGQHFGGEVAIAPTFDLLVTEEPHPGGKATFVGWYQGLVATQDGFRTILTTAGSGAGPINSAVCTTAFTVR